jgi:hypothetical protein
MKKQPEVNESFGELYKMLIAPIKSKLLLTGIELKVFNHLSEATSAMMVAKAISTHPDNTRLFLDGLVACGLLRRISLIRLKRRKKNETTDFRCSFTLKPALGGNSVSRESKRAERETSSRYS